MARTSYIWAIASIVALAACGTAPEYQLPPTPGHEDVYKVRAHFEGVNNIAEFRLHRLIEDYMLDLSLAPDRASAALDAEFDLADLYRQEGYADIAIEHSIARDDAQKTIDVTYRVSEGLQVTTNLSIEGNDSLVTDDLLDLWVRRASGTLGLGDPLFVETDIHAFRGSLEYFYRTRGFLDAEVAAPTIERDPDGSRANVTIHVTEGQAWQLTKIEFEAELEAALGATAAQIRSDTEGRDAAADRLESVRRSVITKLRRDGYPTPTIRLEPSRNPAEQSVQLGVSGSAGQRGKITAVEIRGNEQTATWVVRGFFAFEVGDWYHGPNIDATRRDLYLTGLFRSVTINHEWIDDSNLRIVIEVDEDKSRSVDTLVGYGSYERVRGMLRFEERNVFGTGRRFSVETRASGQGFRAAATVTDPRLFGTRNQLTVSADVFERREPAFTDRARGVTTALSRDLGYGWKVRTGYSFRTHTGSTDELVDEVDDYTQGNAFVELKLDRRDSVLYPRSGFLLDLQVDTDDPAIGSEISFDRVRLAASGYVPVYRDLHLALRAYSGLLWPGVDLTGIPLQERFFNGGENTVRSFRESRLGPRDASNALVGGEFRNVFTAELRLPLRGLLEVAMFADAGNVGSAVDSYGLNNLRYAIGAGVRVQLPIGPVRVDGAFNPEREPGEDEWVVHFSVGYPF